MREKGFIWAIIFVLSVSFCFAQIDVEIDTIKNTITTGDTALFNVTVTNNLNHDDRFRLRFSEDVEWTILTDPLTYKLSRFDLQVGESANFLVKARPSPAANVPFNQYVFALIVESINTDQKGSARMTIGYGPQFTDVEYSAVVSATAEVPAVVDPRKPMNIRLFIKNHNPLNITDLEVIIESELFSKYQNIPLGPRKTRELSFTQDFDDLQKPATDTLSIKLRRNNVTLVSIEKNYQIMAYAELEETTEEHEEFFLKKTTYSYQNIGNHGKGELIKKPISKIDRLFTKTEPDARLIRDGGLSLGWQVNLDPHESQSIQITTDYRPLLFIAVIMLALLVGHRLLKSSVSVDKSAEVIKERDGGITGIQVILTVKNKSAHVKDVWMVDSVPSILHVVRKFSVGTPEPERISTHEHKGTLIKWNLGEMEPGEERIIRYKAKARLTIIGSFNLPAAVLKYTAAAQRIIYSNRLRIVV